MLVSRDPSIVCTVRSARSLFLVAATLSSSVLASPGVARGQATHRVRFDADREDLRVEVESGEECALPCELALSPGAHRFTLARDRMRRSMPEIDVRRDLALSARWEDRSDERVAGWVTLGTAVPLGGLAASVGWSWVMGSLGWAETSMDPPAEAWALVAGGGVLFVSSLVAGLFLGFHFDGATLVADERTSEGLR